MDSQTAYGMILIAILGTVAWWSGRKGRKPVQMTRAQSTARVRALRAQGYKVRQVRLPDGTTAVLRSRAPISHG